MAKTPDPERLELLQGTLDMLILRTLQWGAQHGHGIGQAISSQSDDLLKVETGSLYPALHRLEKRGWLKSEWGISEANHKAKYYQLTAAGKAQLARERDHDRGGQSLRAHQRAQADAHVLHERLRHVVPAAVPHAAHLVAHLRHVAELLQRVGARLLRRFTAIDPLLDLEREMAADFVIEFGHRRRRWHG